MAQRQDQPINGTGGITDVRLYLRYDKIVQKSHWLNGFNLEIKKYEEYNALDGRRNMRAVQSGDSDGDESKLATTADGWLSG